MFNQYIKNVAVVSSAYFWKWYFFIFKAQMDYFGKFNILLNVFEIANHRWKKTPIAIETEQGRKKEIDKSLVVLKG